MSPAMSGEAHSDEAAQPRCPGRRPPPRSGPRPRHRRAAPDPREATRPLRRHGRTLRRHLFAANNFSRPVSRGRQILCTGCELPVQCRCFRCRPGTDDVIPRCGAARAVSRPRICPRRLRLPFSTTAHHRLIRWTPVFVAESMQDGCGSNSSYWMPHADIRDAPTRGEAPKDRLPEETGPPTLGRRSQHPVRALTMALSSWMNGVATRRLSWRCRAQEVFPLAARGAEVDVFAPVPAKRAAAHVNVFNTARRKQLNLDSFAKSVAGSRRSGRRLLTSGLTFGI